MQIYLSFFIIFISLFSTNQAFTKETLTIISPQNEATIRNNAGNITVYIHLPENMDKSTLSLELNGQDYPATFDSETKSFQLNFIDRGKHQIQIKSPNQASKIHTIYLHRFSKLHR